RSLRSSALAGFERSIHRAALAVGRSCFAREEERVIDRRRKRCASIPAPNSDITVRAACERVVPPIVRKAALELHSRKLLLLQQPPKAIQRALYDICLCKTAQRDRFRAGSPCDNEHAAYWQLRPIRRERLPFAAKEGGVSVAPV